MEQDTLEIIPIIRAESFIPLGQLCRSEKKINDETSVQTCQFHALDHEPGKLRAFCFYLERNIGIGGTGDAAPFVKECGIRRSLY